MPFASLTFVSDFDRFLQHERRPANDIAGKKTVIVERLFRASSADQIRQISSARWLAEDLHTFCPVD